MRRGCASYVAGDEPLRFFPMSELAEIERLLPGCRIDRKIGRGGFSTVYGGIQLRLERGLAVKQLSATLVADSEIRRRFVTEARVLGGLDHPHIVSLFDFVDSEHQCLLVMEALSGGSLLDLRNGSALTRADACATAIAACSALGYAHGRSVLHRDVKPANLMFSSEGVLKIVDFGIAKVVGGGESVATADGTILGSPLYMAPEQVLGNTPTPATDVYALSSVLFELLAGRPPFLGTGEPVSLMVRRVESEAPPLGDFVQVPEPLADVVVKGLRRDPEERFTDAVDFGCALAMAATGSFGEGWLGETSVPVFASGALAKALDGAHSGDPGSNPSVLLPTPTAVLPGPPPPPIPSPEMSSLVPVQDLLERERSDASRTVVHKHVTRPVPDETPLEVTPLLEPVLSPVCLHLEISEPALPSRTVEVSSTARFGRKDCEVVLADHQCSRQHFQLVFDGSEMFVEDIGSTNGTRLNGRRLRKRTSVEAGDEIWAGQTTVRVLGVDSEDSKKRGWFRRGKGGPG